MDNIYTVAENFLCIGRCLGFYPFSFDGASRKGIFITKWYDVAASIVLFVTVWIQFAMILIVRGFVESSTKILRVSWGVSIYLEYLAVLFLVGFQLHKRNYFKLFLSQVDSIECKVFLSIGQNKVKTE